MTKIELETMLKKKIRKVRFILLAIFLFFLAIGIVSSVFIHRERIALIYGIVFGFSIAFAFGIVLLVDIFVVRYETVELNDAFITFYRGYFSASLYVNGEEKDYCGPYGYSLETKLRDGTQIVVSMGRWSARMTFSKGHDPVDISYYFKGE